MRHRRWSKVSRIKTRMTPAERKAIRSWSIVILGAYGSIMLMLIALGAFWPSFPTGAPLMAGDAPRDITGALGMETRHPAIPEQRFAR